MASEDVIAAKNSSRNQRAPKKHPKGMFWKTSGMERNPSPILPVAPLVSAMPKKATAAGIAMLPPSTTSHNSFVDDVARPFRTMSSSSLR